MSLIISIRSNTGDWQYRYAFGLHEIFPTAMAIIERGDRLVHIAPNKNEFPIDVYQVVSAKRNRDQFIRQGIPCQPLPALVD